MKNENTLTIFPGIWSKWQIKTTLLALVASVAFPFLIHLIPPVQGTPIGAMLLAMFYAPFIAVLVSRLHVGLIVALVAPILNSLITGHPNWSIVPILTIELTLFVSVVYLINKQNNKIKWLSAPIAYLVVKTISAALILLFPVLLNVQPADFWINSISNGVIGIVVLTIINILIIKFKS